VIQEAQAYPMTYGAYLRRRRLERGWTQLALTMRTGLGQSEISKYEHDKAVPGLPAIIKFARAFDENPPLLDMILGSKPDE
jgi:transcriptional regulator with XRE-family HTH domain